MLIRSLTVRMRRFRNQLGAASKVISIPFLITSVIAGILGNRGDSLLLWAIDRVTKATVTTLWSAVLIFMLLMVGFCFLWHYDRSNLSKRLVVWNCLIKVDSSLLRLLAYLVSTRNLMHSPVSIHPQKKDATEDHKGILDTEIHQLLKKFLKDATQLFPKDVHRAFIFRPDLTMNGEYLVLWESWGGMDEESRQRKRFYVGPQKAGMKRGVAGEVFCSSKLIVTHVSTEDKSWKTDSDGIYICFEPSDKGEVSPSYPPYCAFVCIPILVGDDTHDRLGVLCFDSKNPSVFDRPEVKEMLSLLGTRLAAVLLIYRELQRAPQVYETSAVEARNS